MADRMEAPEGKEWVAGRELDAEIAEKVMCWTRAPETNPPDRVWPIRSSRQWRASGSTVPRALPEFSTSIADAWLVVEKMESLGWDARLDRTHGGYAARFTDEYGTWHQVAVDPRDGGMPCAICLAARAALASTQPNTPPTEGQPT